MESFWMQGVVKNGQVVLESPLDLPDGTVVTVEFDPQHDATAAKLTPEFIRQLSGMWADRPEMSDPEAFVRKMRGSHE